MVLPTVGWALPHRLSKTIPQEACPKNNMIKTISMSTEVSVCGGVGARARAHACAYALPACMPAYMPEEGTRSHYR